jgi:hypothetical protein
MCLQAFAAWLCSAPVVVQLHQLGEVIGHNLCQQHCRTEQAARTGELLLAAAGAAAPTADGSAAVDAANSQKLVERTSIISPPSAKSLEMFLFGRDSGISSTCEDKA